MKTPMKNYESFSYRYASGQDDIVLYVLLLRMKLAI